MKSVTKNSKVYCIHDSMTEIYISKIIIPTQIIFAPYKNDPWIQFVFWQLKNYSAGRRVRVLIQSDLKVISQFKVVSLCPQSHVIIEHYVPTHDPHLLLTSKSRNLGPLELRTLIIWSLLGSVRSWDLFYDTIVYVIISMPRLGFDFGAQ